MSSIGGKKTLRYFTAGQNFEKGEESALKDTQYELLVTIAKQGYSNLIMDAAKGTGSERAEQFLGLSLVKEKELVLIVVRTEQKDRIMRAIMDAAGLSSKAQGIVFSLPVTDTAGMRLTELAEDPAPAE